MKNFLKSTAIFACIALLFCACSEDTTDDAPVVESSSIRSVTPGNGKFQVKWTVPTDDEITRCVISWSDNNGVSGDYCVAAVAGTMTETISGLSAGTYDVTVENYGETRIDSTPVSVSGVEVYDATSFSAPEIVSALVEMNGDGVNVLIEWEEGVEDCTGVIISYTDVNDAEQKSSLLSVYEAATLSDVKGGSTCSYTAFFHPEGGLDEVILPSAGETSIPSSADAPAAPESVAVYSGDYKFRVNWELADGDTQSKSAVILYNNGEATSYYFVESVSDKNEIYIDTPELGDTYTVSVRNVSSNGMMSDVVEGDSEAIPYDWASFKSEYKERIPDYTAMYYNDTTFVLTINWTATLNCDNIYLSYTYDVSGSTKELSITREKMEAGERTIIDAMPGSTYEINTRYVMAGNGLDTLNSNLIETFPDASVTKYFYDLGTDDSKVYKITQLDLPGDATINSSSSYGYSFESIFNNEYCYGYTNGYQGAKQYVTENDSTFVYQTLSFDLGREYKLSEMSYTTYSYYKFDTGRPTIKKFSLYASAKDPNAPGNEDMLAVTDATKYYDDYMQIPDLSGWDCLLFEQDVYGAYVVTSPGVQYDYNGDGVIDGTDDYDLIEDNMIRFAFSEYAEPVRYIRIQFLENYNTSYPTQFYISELDFWHKGAYSDYDGQ
ncbi:MAG: DUF4998 domain-containing protein [Rikenellaceae bacterium]